MGSENVNIISKSCENFSIELCKHILSDGKEDTVISPFGAYLLLATTVYGADKNTRSQIEKGLHLSDDELENLQGFHDLLDSMNKSSDIHLAHKVFVSNKLNIKPEFQAKLEKYFHSAFKTTDFSKSSETVKLINDWCKKMTKDNITQIIENVDADTRMLLVNALYFKGKWKEPFPEYNTKLKVFHLDEENEIKVDTMYNEHYMFYGELDDIDAKFIRLRYKSKQNISMVIVVPRKIQGLKKIIDNLESINYDRISKCEDCKEVTIYVPKFKIESTLHLRPYIEKMGMTEMFTNRANFDKIIEKNCGNTDNEEIKIDDILQKVSIKVDEEGTVATQMSYKDMIRKRRMNFDKKILRADRPFLTIIMFDQLPLFYSKYMGKNM